MVVRCIAKVVQAYMLDHETQRTFQPHGAVAYDERILNWRGPDRVVSIWTLAGRIMVPVAAAPLNRVKDLDAHLDQHRQQHAHIAVIVIEHDDAMRPGQVYRALDSGLVELVEHRRVD